MKSRKQNPRLYDSFNNRDMLTAKRALGYVTEEEVTTWMTVDKDELTSAVLTDHKIVE